MARDWRNGGKCIGRQGAQYTIVFEEDEEEEEEEEAEEEQEKEKKDKKGDIIDIDASIIIINLTL